MDLSEGGKDESVAKLLLKNARIKIEEIPDPENPSLTIYTFGYQAKFNNVRNRTGLLAQINRSKNGVRRIDLLDSYEGIADDIEELITSGDVVAVLNSENKDKILYPRGEPFLVELDGHISVEDLSVDDLVKKFMPPNVKVPPSSDPAAAGNHENAPVPIATPSNPAPTEGQSEIMTEIMHRAQLEKQKSLYVAKTDVDPRKQIRRGEALWVGGQWFRISSAVREGVPLSEQPTKAQAPLSVTSRKELSKKNEVEGYIRPFEQNCLPLDHPLTKEAMENVRLAKEAQKKLHKVAAAHGRALMTGGAGAQLLSSNATAMNPETLAAAFASTASSAGLKRRPKGLNRLNNASHLNTKKNADQIEAAKKAASDPSLLFSHARRHGCTLDVRELYLATKSELPHPEKEVEIHNMMVEFKLLDPDEPMKRPQMSKKNMTLDENGRPRKRRYYEKKNQRKTNTHLDGTEIGQALAAAAEKQHQGKSVGDGGM